jgi:hypothetical protein
MLNNPKKGLFERKVGENIVKVLIEVEIPDYDIKYCDDTFHGKRCKFLQSYDYGFKHYCILSGKDITKIKDRGNKICRPYGCRCMAKGDK